MKYKPDLQKAIKEASKKNWKDFVRELEANLDKDPYSNLGIALGKRCMDLVNSIYGEKYITLRNVIWEKGFKTGHAGEESGLSPASVAWLDKAMEAYYRGRIYSILNQVDNQSSNGVLKLWDDLLRDMYGDDQASKNDIIKAAMNDNKVSQHAKAWLEKISG